MLKSKAKATTIYLKILRVTENKGVLFSAEFIRFPKKTKVSNMRFTKVFQLGKTFLMFLN